MDVDLPSSSKQIDVDAAVSPIILPMSTIRIVIDGINLFEMLNSYHSYSSEMDRGDPFTTPPTMSNIPEKHPSVLKLAEQSDSEHKTFANGGGTEEGGMESEGGGACESNSNDE